MAALVQTLARPARRSVSSAAERRTSPPAWGYGRDASRPAVRNTRHLHMTACGMSNQAVSDATLVEVECVEGVRTVEGFREDDMIFSGAHHLFKGVRKRTGGRP